VPEKPPSDRRKVVFVVEDERAIGELIANAISDQPGYSAVLIPDAAKALETAKHLAPDVLVVDVRLPGMSGLELYDKLQSDPRTQHVPVLFETANGSESAVEFRKRGIATYVEKPFDLGQVVGFVKRLATGALAGT
jgi:DNA-binding response OmpR family regulator